MVLDSPTVGIGDSLMHRLIVLHFRILVKVYKKNLLLLFLIAFDTIRSTIDKLKVLKSNYPFCGPKRNILYKQTRAGLSPGRCEESSS